MPLKLSTSYTAGDNSRCPVPDHNPKPALIAHRLTQIQQVLERILTWEYPADAVLSRWLREHPKLGARDRGQVAQAVFDVLRHLRRYRHYAQSGSDVGSHTRCLALLGLAATLPTDTLLQTRQTGKGLRLEEAQWLQRVQQIDVARLPRAVRWSVPDWLAARLFDDDAIDPDALLAALNQPAPLDLRINPLKVASRGVRTAFARSPTPSTTFVRRKT